MGNVFFYLNVIIYVRMYSLPLASSSALGRQRSSHRPSCTCLIYLISCKYSITDICCFRMLLWIEHEYLNWGKKGNVEVRMLFLRQKADVEFFVVLGKRNCFLIPRNGSKNAVFTSKSRDWVLVVLRERHCFLNQALKQECCVLRQRGEIEFL